MESQIYATFDDILTLFRVALCDDHTPRATSPAAFCHNLADFFQNSNFDIAGARAEGSSALAMSKFELWKKLAKSRMPQYMDGRLKAIFLSWKPVEIWKKDTNIIWTSSKSTHFSKIQCCNFKNCACYALLNFEIQIGVADPSFEQQPCNFEKLCIF